MSFCFVVGSVWWSAVSVSGVRLHLQSGGMDVSGVLVRPAPRCRRRLSTCLLQPTRIISHLVHRSTGKRVHRLAIATT
jgi:hypothetical protein